MRVTIREDGSEEPPGSAELILTEGDGSQTRTFTCSACGQNFEAVAGATTVHECVEADISQWEQGDETESKLTYHCHNVWRYPHLALAPEDAHASTGHIHI